MKNKLSSQVPFLAIITIIAIIALVVIVLSSKQTLIVDEEGNIIGEGVAGLRTARGPTRGGPEAGPGLVNPNSDSSTGLGFISTDSLLYSCKQSFDLKTISPKGPTDPKAEGSGCSLGACYPCCKTKGSGSDNGCG